MFRELFPKVLKWALSTFFTIWGIHFLLMIREDGEIWPFIFVILFFGIVYWLYKSPKDIPWQVMIASLCILLGSAAAALYIIIDIPIFNVSFSLTWCLWALIIGTPTIAYCYHKFK